MHKAVQKQCARCKFAGLRDGEGGMILGDGDAGVEEGFKRESDTILWIENLIILFTERCPVLDVQNEYNRKKIS